MIFYITRSISHLSEDFRYFSCKSAWRSLTSNTINYYYARWRITCRLYVVSGYTFVNNIHLTVYGTKRDKPKKHTDRACKKVSAATTDVNSDNLSQKSPVTTGTTVNIRIYAVIIGGVAIIFAVLFFIYKKGSVHGLHIYGGNPAKDVNHLQMTQVVLLPDSEVTVDPEGDNLHNVVSEHTNEQVLL